MKTKRVIAITACVFFTLVVSSIVRAVLQPKAAREALQLSEREHQLQRSNEALKRTHDQLYDELLTLKEELRSARAEKLQLEQPEPAITNLLFNLSNVTTITIQLK